MECRHGVMLPIMIDRKTVVHPVLVSDITDPLILGLDFMRSHHCQIDVSMREFNIDGEHNSHSRKAGYSAAVKVRLGANPPNSLAVPSNCMGRA